MNDDQRPQGIEQMHALKQTKERNNVGDTGHQHEKEKQSPKHRTEGHLVTGEKVCSHDGEEKCAGSGQYRHEYGVSNIWCDKPDTEIVI